MEVQTETQERYLEDCLKHSGWGLYCKFIIGLVSTCHLIQGLTFITMSFAVSLSSCDQLQIPEGNASRIFTCFLIGSSIGGMIGNSLSDRYGRKRYMIYSLIAIFASCFVAAFAYNVYVVVGATLILGVGLEINATQTKLLVTEVLEKEHRGFWVLFCSMFYVIGYVVTIVLVILFETQTVFTLDLSTPKQLTSWRTMFAVCGGVSLIAACASALMEESPRYYLLIGRNYLAYLLLKQLFAINNSKFAENFQIKEEQVNNLIHSYGLNYVEPGPYWEKGKFFLRRFYNGVKLAFSKRFCKLTALFILLKTPLIVIGIFQLNICLSKLMASPADQFLEKYRGLDFIFPILEPRLDLSEESNNVSISRMCQEHDRNVIFYGSMGLLGACLVPGQVMGLLIVDTLGRKCICFSGLVISSCSLLIMGFVPKKLVQLIAMCFTVASIGTVISTITLVNMEVFPTAIRGTTSALTSIPGLLLSIFFVNLIVIDRQIFTIILGILYFCLAIFTCFLPETRKKPMVE